MSGRISAQVFPLRFCPFDFFWHHLKFVDFVFHVVPTHAFLTHFFPYHFFPTLETTSVFLWRFSKEGSHYPPPFCYFDATHLFDRSKRRMSRNWFVDETNSGKSWVVCILLRQKLDGKKGLLHIFCGRKHLRKPVPRPRLGETILSNPIEPRGLLPIYDNKKVQSFSFSQIAYLCTLVLL